MEILEQMTLQIHVNKIYDVLETIDRIFRQHKIAYSLICGTLLGAIRHGGLIPWDDDIDIAILELDVEKFLSLTETFKSEGYGTTAQCLDLWGAFKVFPLDGDPLPEKNSRDYLFPAADIFPFAKKNEKLVYRFDIARSLFPDEHLYQKEWENLGDLEFGHLLLRGPQRSDAERYLKTVFGSKWATHGEKLFDHQAEESVCVLEFSLSNTKPALKTDY